MTDHSAPEGVYPSSPFAVTSIILSMALVALGNGLLFAYIPVKLAAEGFAPWVAGATITSLAGGGLLGCIMAGRIVRRVGHARSFASMAAVIILSALALGVTTNGFLWVGSRALYGFAITGLFIVSQSWLNDVAEDSWRGRIIAIFYMGYVLSLGIGSYLLSWISLDGEVAPMLAACFATLAILPVGLTKLRTPPPPESAQVAIAAVWRISPVGLVGCLVVGGLTMMVQGFAPIYATAVGMPKDDIALLLFLMQFGMIAVQMPLGALSDRIDRRHVLILASVLVVLAALAASQIGTGSLILVIVVFGIWAGATEAIYAVSNAHANDRAEPQYYVSLSSTLLIAWSISGLVLPTIATLLTEFVGPRAFMFLAIFIASGFALFVLYRVLQRDPVPDADQEPYQAISAQAPYSPDLAPSGEEEARS